MRLVSFVLNAGGRLRKSSFIEARTGPARKADEVGAFLAGQ